MDAFSESSSGGILSSSKARWGLMATVAVIGSLALFMLIKAPNVGIMAAKPSPTSSVVVKSEKTADEKPQPAANALATITSPALPTLAVKDTATPSPKGTKDASVTSNPTPKGTRGSDAIVRWSQPTAEGLTLLESGKAKEAGDWSEAHRAQLNQQGNKATAWNDQLTARALAAQGKYTEASVIFKSLSQTGRPAEFAPDALFGEEFCKAQGVADNISEESLKKILDFTTPEPSWGQARAAFEYGKRMEKSQKTKSTNDEEARDCYQHALLSNLLEEPLEKECLEHLDALTESLIFNPKRATTEPKTIIHKVAAGDSLSRISKKYGVPITQITHMNKLDPKASLHVGKALKIIPGDAILKVDRWRLTATLLIGGTFIHQYPVGIGGGENTPAGTFTVRTKVTNPDWWYGGKKVPFGSPENILGTRWIGFDRDEHGGKAASIGVHGTSIPESVPGRESKGCVRLKNADVEELFDFIPQGATVEIND